MREKIDVLRDIVAFARKAFDVALDSEVKHLLDELDATEADLLCRIEAGVRKEYGATGQGEVRELLEKLSHFDGTRNFLRPVVREIEHRMKMRRMNREELARVSNRREKEVADLLEGKDVPIEVLTAVLCALELEMLLSLRDRADAPGDEVNWRVLYGSYRGIQHRRKT